MSTGNGGPIDGTGSGPAQVYRCGGLTIRSDLTLAARPANSPPDTEVLAGEVRTIPMERPSAQVIAERVVDGVPWYTFARQNGHTVGRFPGLADFVIDGSGRHLVYHRDPGVDPEVLAILTTGSVAAYLLASTGTLVVHASAVEVDGKAVAFVGQSGQGKTTVATMLCADGFPLVTDDLLPVEPDRDTVWCTPSGIELRIREKAEELVERFPEGTVWRRTADERSAVAATTTALDRLPLRAVVIPWPDRELDHVQVRRVGAGAAAFTLARYQRIEGWTSPGDLRSQFEKVTALVAAVPVLEARVPWGPPFPRDFSDELLAAIGREEGA